MSLRGFLAASVPAALIALLTLPACQATAGVSEVYTSLDGDGSRRRETFFTDSTEIHCIVKAMFGRPDVTIRASFHRKAEYDFADNNFRDVDVYSAGVDFRPDRTSDRKEPVIIDFALSRLDATGAPSDKVPYVAGSYVCEIEIDGEKVDLEAPFNVDFPDCPQGFITSAATCLGYFKADTACPRGGLKSRDPEDCTCKAAGWDCE